MGLSFMPGDGTKPSWVEFVVCTFLGEDPAHATRGRVNAYVNRAVRRIIDRDESGGVDDGIFESLHGLIVLLSPDECLAFASKMDQGPCQCRVVLDPYAHESCGAQKSMDISKIFTRWPVPNMSNFGIVRDTPFIIAFVNQYDDFWHGDEELL